MRLARIGCLKDLNQEAKPLTLYLKHLGTNLKCYSLKQDTSDDKSRLSTLLLKQHDPKFDDGCRRISHPKTDAEHRAKLGKDAIKSWADRMIPGFN